MVLVIFFYLFLQFGLNDRHSFLEVLYPNIYCVIVNARFPDMTSLIRLKLKSRRFLPGVHLIINQRYYL